MAATPAIPGSVTDALFERFYFSRAGYVGGTTVFHELCAGEVPSGGTILEIGAGPDNPTSHFLASLGRLSGVDVSGEVFQNRALMEARTFDGRVLPFGDEAFDACVSNYVLEHVADPVAHFAEVARVLRPEGVYLFRTPNLLHYVTLVSRLLPHATHRAVANRLRGLGEEAHEPWPTHYRANSAGAIQRLAHRAGLRVRAMHMLEKEPSYGRASRLLFYPMMAYERLVNMSERLGRFRSNIVGILERPEAR